jgi:hypothetical protein
MANQGHFFSEHLFAGFNRGGVFSKIQMFLYFLMHPDMVVMASIFQGRGMRILIVWKA